MVCNLHTVIQNQKVYIFGCASKFLRPTSKGMGKRRKYIQGLHVAGLPTEKENKVVSELGVTLCLFGSIMTARACRT